MVKDFAFTGFSRFDKVAVEYFENVFANLGQLSLDLVTVRLDLTELSFVALCLRLKLSTQFHPVEFRRGRNKSA